MKKVSLLAIIALLASAPGVSSADTLALTSDGSSVSGDSGIDAHAVSDLLSATTISGFGISDAYTKTEVNTKFDNLGDLASKDLIDSSDITDGAVTANKLGASSVTTTKIDNNAVTADKLAANSVTEAKINDGAVTTAKINDGAVTNYKIADDSISETKIQGSAVTTDKLADNSVTEAKINDGAVTTAKIDNSAVTADKLAANSVTEAKINDGAVTTAKINDGAVTTDKLVDGAVTNYKIADDSISETKIQGSAVTTDKLADNSISTAKIQDNAVEFGKLSSDVQNTLNLVGNGDFTSATNIASSSTTLTDAILNLDTTIGDMTTISGAHHAALGNDTIAGAIAAIDTRIDDVIRRDGNYGSGSNLIHIGQNSIVLDETTGDMYFDGTGSDTLAIRTVSAKDASFQDVATTDITGDGIYTSTYNIAATDTLTAAASKLDATIGDMTTLRNQINSGTLVGSLNNMYDYAESNIIRLDGRIDSVEARLDDMTTEMRSMFAGAAAMSALVPNARAKGNTQISFGAGTYRDQYGIAAGAFHYVNDNILLNAGAAYSNDNFTGRVGVTIGW
ncbi:MAG: YadA C-terminal domain-containing protein [Rickettsiales bacterium]|jgi:hypothetical protein|nr:YadA C-terminal domain-containing protein [Rickettsiales bacterium]